MLYEVITRRVSFVDEDLAFSPHALGNRGRHAGNALLDLLPPLFVEGPHDPFQPDFIRYDIRTPFAYDPAKGDHCRSGWTGIPADNLL